MANKTWTKIAMSKPVGKILDNKFVKKSIVPMGNKIISGTKKVVNKIAAPLVKEMKIQEAKDKAYRTQSMNGANQWKGLPNNIKIK